jgi:hypothetical protein
MTSLTGSPSFWGRTYSQLYSSPAWHSSRQNPSWMSNLAMKIFLSSFALAKVWMIRLSDECPIWSINPAGASRLVVSLTEGICLSVSSQKENNRSKIERKAQDLCSIAATRDFFLRRRVVPDIVPQNDPRLPLSYLFVHLNPEMIVRAPVYRGLHFVLCLIFPVLIGHPYFDPSARRSLVGCTHAKRVGPMPPW